MGLFLGNNKYTLYLDGIVYRIATPGASKPTVSSIVLLSSDNYILKDSNNLYLTVKEDE